MSDRTAVLRLSTAWCAMSVVGLAGLRAALAGPPPHADLAALLAWTCAVVTALAGAVLTASTTTLLLQAIRGRLDPLSARGTRRVVLACCGLATAGAVGLAAPASARSQATPEPTPTLPATAISGLPLPERTIDAPPPPDATDRGTARPRTVVVRAGDSVWSIARRTAGPDASAQEVDACWRRLLRLNAEALAPDPDLVHPGQVLRLPTTAPQEDR